MMRISLGLASLVIGNGLGKGQTRHQTTSYVKIRRNVEMGKEEGKTETRSK